jgi:hypothetical protein
MGNSNSSQSLNKADEEYQYKEASFTSVLDRIASKYILTTRFENMLRLVEKDYCDKLILLTSDILERYFNHADVEYLSLRTKNGVDENVMASENVIFVNKDDLNSLNKERSSSQKRRLCIGIAKFYVQVAHVFASIITTLNPVYVYKDSSNQTQERTYLERDSIPKGVEKKLVRYGICDRRIQSLKRGQSQAEKGEQGNFIGPDVCSFYLDNRGELKHLDKEPGILELMNLYLDKYDYVKGEFVGMTEETEKQFRQDLQAFYKAFTGNETMPDTIQKFSDIPLRDFRKDNGCQRQGNNNIPYSKMYKKSDDTGDLFQHYANNLKFMMQHIEKLQGKLLDIVNQIFTYVVDKETGDRNVIIHPALTETSLKKIIKDTRSLIVELYTGCEEDYINGIKIFQAVVEKKIQETARSQIQELQKTSEEILYG